MSTLNSVGNLLDMNINNYIQDISNRYNIPKEELQKTWVEISVSKEQNTDVRPSDDIITQDISKQSRKTLVALCKERGIKNYSKKKKSELITLLINYKQSSTSKNKKCKKDNPKSNKVKRSKLKIQIPTILIKRNTFNNYEHSETKLVFDTNQIVIGTQNHKNGTVNKLTEMDIDKCKSYKFEYKLPNNLENNKMLDVKVMEELNDNELLDDNKKHIENIEEELTEEELMEDDIDLEDDIV